MKSLSSLFASRKGEGDETLGWSSIALILYIIVVGVTALILVFSMFNIKKSQTEIPGLVREEAYLTRFMLAPDCLAYTDPSSGRVEGSVIDWSRVATSEQLALCYPASETDWQVQITIERSSGDHRTVRSEHYRTAGIADSIIRRPVIVRDGASEEAGTLILFVQT